MMKELHEWVVLLARSQASLEVARAEALLLIASASKIRDDAIRGACDTGGLSQAEVARITGLTRGRIHQIVRGEESDA